jgi:glycosyltransferase involved in cell wall biosynthesis
VKVALFSWEFPPKIVGGIARHVYGLSRALVREGVETLVFTCEFPGTPREERVDGVRVFRVDSYRAPAPDLGTWDFLMNQSMEESTAEILASESNRVDLLHAHEWLVAKAAIGLKHTFRVPLVATIHATEFGRRNGLHDDSERMIHQTEHWLTFEAWRVICCSRYMANHVSWLFSLPPEKVDAIPNGVDVTEFVGTFNKANFRKQYALPEEKIVLFVGRLVYEKGASLLVEAMPRILARANAKFIFVGEGYMKEQLLSTVQHLGLAHKAFFTGFVDEKTLKQLYRVADVCAFPSLYEPFGIVALEAMAARTPVVVSDTGGLSEIVDHDQTGVKVYHDNVESLAWGVIRVLTDPAYADRLRTNAARRMLDLYSWNQVAVRTRKVYEHVLEEYEKGSWKTAAPFSKNRVDIP